MLKYKISNGSNLGSNIHISNNMELYNAVNQDYRKYYDAPLEYKLKYSFIMHAIYACLIKANNNQDINEFKDFLRDIEATTNLEVKAKRDTAGTISFVSKVKIKRKIK